MVYQDDISTQIAEDQIALTMDAECAMCKRSQLLDLSWCSGQAYNISDIEYQCYHCNDRTQFFLSKVTKLDHDAEIKARYRYNNGGWMEKRLGLEAGAYDLGDLVPEDARLNIMKLYVKLKEQARTARDEDEFDDFGMDAVRPGDGFGTKYHVGGVTPPLAGRGDFPHHGVGAIPPRVTPPQAGRGDFHHHGVGAIPPRNNGVVATPHARRDDPRDRRVGDTFPQAGHGSPFGAGAPPPARDPWCADAREDMVPAEEETKLVLVCECSKCKQIQNLSLTWLAGKEYNISEIEEKCNHCRFKRQFFVCGVVNLEDGTSISASFRCNNGPWMTHDQIVAPFDLAQCIPQGATLNIMKLSVNFDDVESAETDSGREGIVPRIRARLGQVSSYLTGHGV